MYGIHKFNLVLVLIFAALVVEASSYQWRSETFMSRQTGDDLSTESPLFESFMATYINLENDQRMDLNFDLGTDLATNKNSFNIRQMDARFGFDKNRGHFTIGRGFQNIHLIKSRVIDSLGIDYALLSRRLRLGALIGRSTQKGENQVEKSVFATSVFTDYQTLDVFPWNFGFRLENQDFSEFSRDVQRTAKVSLRKEFSAFHHPELMASSEKNLVNENGYRYELGFNFYPTSDFIYGLKYQKYNIPSTYGAEDPVFTMFSAGESADSTLLLGKVYGAWYSGLEYSHCEYPLNQERRTAGKKIELIQKWHNEFMAFDFAGFNIESFGGTLVGDRIGAQYAINDKYIINFNNEYVSYQKITSAKNIASSTQVGLEMKWDKKKLWLAGELNSNNYYSKDFRLVAQFTILDYGSGL